MAAEPRRQTHWKPEFHHGADFNYGVGPNGQTGLNLKSPALRSPVIRLVKAIVRHRLRKRWPTCEVGDVLASFSSVP
jgi:hypothetical protein